MTNVAAENARAVSKLRDGKYVASVKEYRLTKNSREVRVTKMIVLLDRLDLTVSVSPFMNRSSGFVREGYGEPYLETWDGRRIINPNQLRCYCRYFDQHREHVRSGRQIIAVISAGNYGPNKEYIILINDPENTEPELDEPLPVLFRRRDEDVCIGDGRDYYAFLVSRNRSFAADRVRFSLSDSGNQGRVLRQNGEDITDQVLYVLTGPPLVWDGVSLSLSEIVPRWACDIRHILGAVSIPLPNGGLMILGS